MQFEWWHWIVAGLFMLLAELALPAFVLIWFGVAAVLLGLLLLILPILGLVLQLSLWLVFSVALVILWFRVFKPGQFKTRVGMSNANVVGEIGLLVADVGPFQKGEVRFQKPVLGSEVWPCIADDTIAAGERVRVLEVEGNLIKVGKNN